MVDNPFATKPLTIPSLSTVKPPDEVKPPEPSELKVETDEESPLQIVQRILAEHNGLESDIPVNLVEYWNAKRRL